MLICRAMFDDDLNQRKGDNRGPKKPAGGFNIPTFTWVAWIAIIGCIVAWTLLHNRMTPQAAPLSTMDFFQKFRAKQIASATVNMSQQMSDTADIVGTYYKADKDGKILEPKAEVPFVVPNVQLTPSLKEELQLSPGKSGNIKFAQPNAMLSALGYNLLFFLGIALLFWFFFIRQIKLAGKGALSFGKSKARLLAKDRNKVTFKDVAGVDEAIEEVSELVEFLKDPKKLDRKSTRLNSSHRCISYA